MKDNAINEIYSDFYHSIDTNSKSNPNYEIFQRNHQRSVTQNCLQNKKSIERLIAFISDKNKFYINPNFDQEGSKKFLQSKYIAMEKIILDDDIKDPKSKKNNSKQKSPVKSDCNDEKLYLDVKKEKFFDQKNDNKLKETNLNSNKDNNSHKKKTSKIKNQINSSIEFRLTLTDSNISEELKVKKKQKKNKDNCNKFELKMLKDKKIKNLEPIDEVNNMNTSQNTIKNGKNYNSKYQFIGKGKSNNSIINIITEMQRKNAH